MSNEPDYIVVGSGINALVCAAILGGKGERVLVLERNDRIGGCMRSDEITAPGFVHDVMAMTFILFVTGNAMAHSIRERTNELAVLKTLGFSEGRILTLVLLESCLIAAIGGGIGLLLAWGIIARGDPTGGLLPAFYFPVRDLIVGVGLLLALGLATGMLPAFQASRLRIVDALRRTG